MGSPGATEERSIVKSVRFTPSEWAAIERAAGRYGIEPSRVVRRAALKTIREVLGEPPAPRLPF